MIAVILDVIIMDAAKKIRQYYFDNIGRLPLDKQFHFASRMAAWLGDERAAPVLADLKDYMTGSGNLGREYRSILDRPVRHVYAKSLRLEYFDKYPNLFGLHNAFFRIRHLKEVYGIDSREIILDMVGLEQMEKLYWELRGDSQAVRILSRFAIDYIYLFEILFGRGDWIAPAEIFLLKDGYNLSDKSHLHLLIYLFTHSIIAESNFYVRRVPGKRLADYREMLSFLETIFQAHNDLKLDVKFEYLVANRICAYESSFFEVFKQEGANSLSPRGEFIIDRSIGEAGARMNSFESSEHRNVLYIMSGSSYDPVPVSPK